MVNSSSKEYLLIILLFFSIFLFNLTGFFSLDYTPIIRVDVFKQLWLNNFNNLWLPFELLKILLSSFNLLDFLFSTAVLISFLILHYYSKKLFKNYSLLATFILIFNPFIYSRIMVGQIGVIMSYSLLIPCVYYLLELFRNKFKFKTILKLCIFASFMFSFQPQTVLLFGIILLITSINLKVRREYIKPIIILSILLLLLNSFWIQGFLFNNFFETITHSDMKFFSPKLSQNVPTVAKIIGGWGFWRENAHITTYNTLPLWLWYGLTLLLIILMLIGYFTTNNNSSKTFFMLWWIGVILGTGRGHPYTSPLFNLLFNYFPFFSGFRDSHKLVILIILAYAYLCPLGVKWVQKKLKRIPAKLITISLIICIILYTYPLIGLGGQKSPAEYPSSYFETNNFLKNENIKGYLIYLPWESYLTYNWSLNTSPDGRIAVPINNVVGSNVLVSSGLWGAETEFTNNITNCLNNQSITCLEENNVQFVLFDKCAYYITEYEWIKNSLVHEDNCIKIYELYNKEEVSETVIPFRFYMGACISAITLFGILTFIIKK